MVSSITSTPGYLGAHFGPELQTLAANVRASKRTLQGPIPVVRPDRRAEQVGRNLISAEGVALLRPRTGGLQWLSVACGAGGLTRGGEVAAVVVDEECRSVQRFDTATLAPLGAPVSFDGPITRVALSAERLAVAFVDGRTLIVDLATGARFQAPPPPQTLPRPRVQWHVNVPRVEAPNGGPEAMEWSPDGARLALGYAHALAMLWTWGEPAPRALDAAALRLAFFADGRMVTVDDRALTVRDAAGAPLGRPIEVTDGGNIEAPGVVLAEDGTRIGVWSDVDAVLIGLGETARPLTDDDLRRVTRAGSREIGWIRGAPQPPRPSAGTFMWVDGTPAADLLITATPRGSGAVAARARLLLRLGAGVRRRPPHPHRGRMAQARTDAEGNNKSAHWETPPGS